MKIALYVILICWLSIFCTCAKQVLTQSSNREIVENGLFFENTFGDEESLGEFRLTESTGSHSISVTENGDVIVPDRGYLQIYDADGNPKQIIDGPVNIVNEQNEGIIDIHVAENGYFVVEANFFASFGIYAPDYTLVKKVSLLDIPLQQYFDSFGIKYRWLSIRNLYAFGTDEFIFVALWNDARFESTTAYVYVRNGTSTIIKEFKDKYEYNSFIMVNSEFQLLPDKRIIFIDEQNDRIKRGDKWYYLIQVYSLDTHEISIIEHPYIPVKIAELMNTFQDSTENKNTELIYYDPIRNYWIDGKYIFVATNKTDREKGHLVDVIDSDTGRHVRSAYFQEVNIDVIRNGVAYGWTSAYGGITGYGQISKYRINP